MKAAPTFRVAVVAAALLVNLIAWGRLAPVMAAAPIEGLCSVAQSSAASRDDSQDGAPPLKADHCPLGLLVGGLSNAPSPPGSIPPETFYFPAFVMVGATADYVGWFLSTLQARGPPTAVFSL